MSDRPLRVLHVITRMIVGGAQENTMLSCALADPARFRSELLTGTQTGPEGELHTESRARGVQLEFEPNLVREIAPERDLLAIWRLWRRMRRARYDVVHTHSSKAGIVGRIAARLAGVPVIVHTIHGWGFNGEQPKHVSQFYIWLERLCARHCGALVVVGLAYRDEGLALGIGQPEQYLLIRSGIEVEAYRDVVIQRSAARRRIGVPEDAFVVGNVGRLSPPKCPELMVAAFDRLARQHADARLVMVGDGWQRAELEAEIRRRGLAERVHLLGLRRDVPELLRAFDVFILSSSREGLPRTVVQAMAAGLPVVCTRAGAVADAVVDGESGWIVEVGDAEGIGERLIRLAGDRDLARRMGERGRARVEEFSARRMVQQLTTLYEQLARDARAVT